MPLITKLAATTDAPWEPIAPDKIIAGMPETRTVVLYEDATAKHYAGEWEATVGTWRIAYTEWEYVRMLAGHCVVTGDDGTTIEAGPGDAFVIEPGFTGTWEVRARMHKLWVIREG
jgi:hypothetical protein